MKKNNSAMRLLGMALTIALVTGIGTAQRAEAECDANQMIDSITIANQGQGKDDIPSCVLDAASKGDVNPMQTWMLTNSQYSGCSDKIIDGAPAPSDSYAKAKQTFTNGVCGIFACYRYAMLISLLPTLSTDTSLGGSTSSGARCANLKLMMQTWNQQLSGCTANNEINDQIFGSWLQQQSSGCPQ